MYNYAGVYGFNGIQNIQPNNKIQKSILQKIKYRRTKRTLKDSGLIPVFIGLPGAGKSTMSKIFSNILNKEVISTDELFRIYRAVGLFEFDNAKQEVMRNFLDKARNMIGKNVNPDNKKPRVFTKEDYNKLYQFATKNKLSGEDNTGTLATNSKTPCKLKSSDIKTGFRSFGEHIFRLFEIEMNKYLVKEGKFNGKIPDLSASALLYEENKQIFSPKNGYLIILLDTPKEKLLQNLVSDYNKYEDNSLKANEIKNIRGAYEGAVNNAFENHLKGKNLTSKIENYNSLGSTAKKLALMNAFRKDEGLQKVRDKIIESALSKASQEDRDFRINKYKKNATLIINPVKENREYKSEKEILGSSEFRLKVEKIIKENNRKQLRRSI